VESTASKARSRSRYLVGYIEQQIEAVGPLPAACSIQKQAVAKALYTLTMASNPGQPCMVLKVDGLVVLASHHGPVLLPSGPFLPACVQGMTVDGWRLLFSLRTKLPGKAQIGSQLGQLGSVYQPRAFYGSQIATIKLRANQVAPGV